MSFKINIEISENKVANLLCSAFEGGSNHWCEIKKYIEPKEIWKWDSEKVFKHVQYPLSKRGGVVVKDHIGKQTKTLNRTSITKGLAVMQMKFPAHYGNFLSGKDDAETGDVFLQCCLFCDVIYS